MHSQGGVKVPTGGNGHGDMPQARERFARQRQLIRCDSEADGDSPDERELQETALHSFLRVLHKECYNGILQLRSSLCNTVQNVRQSGL